MVNSHPRESWSAIPKIDSAIPTWIGQPVAKVVAFTRSSQVLITAYIISRSVGVIVALSTPVIKETHVRLFLVLILFGSQAGAQRYANDRAVTKQSESVLSSEKLPEQFVGHWDRLGYDCVDGHGKMINTVRFEKTDRKLVLGDGKFALTGRSETGSRCVASLTGSVKVFQENPTVLDFRTDDSTDCILGWPLGILDSFMKMPVKLKAGLLYMETRRRCWSGTGQSGKITEIFQGEAGV